MKRPVSAVSSKHRLLLAHLQTATSRLLEAQGLRELGLLWGDWGFGAREASGALGRALQLGLALSPPTWVN